MKIFKKKIKKNEEKKPLFVGSLLYLREEFLKILKKK